MESLSGPLQRNHSNFSRKLSNANGLSSKNAYDDVFAGLPKLGASSTFEGYTEIFCSSRASSIPVLDLSDLDDTNVSSDFRNSTPDYSSIFVGFSDEHIGMSYDQLFDGPPNSSAKTRTSSAIKFPGQLSDRSSSMEQNQSFDAVKQLNMSYNKTSQEIKDERKVTTHVTELRAVPGFTCFIDETTPLNKTQDGKRKPPAINDVRQKMDFGSTPPLPKKETRGFVRSRNGSSWDGTYSNGKLFANPIANEIHLKSHPSNLEKSNGSFKTSAKVASEKDDSRTDARDRLANSSDEELDLNSSAAASVAALKIAIEKAQESIRFAKELMEKKEGTQIFPKKSSKSRSKVGRESSAALRRNHTDELNSKETFENTRVLFLTKDLDAAEKCEAATGFFELINKGKHRRAISAFEQVDKQEFPKMETSGDILEQQEATAEKAEVVVEASASKEDMEREEDGFKVSHDEEKNLDKLESTFVVHELEEIDGIGAKEVEQENCEEENKEEDEFFETQDWDDDKDEEEGLVVEDGSLELVANEQKQELLHEQQQQMVEERSKEAAVIEENDEHWLANKLEEAFHWVENEIRVREVFDSHSNEPKQINENPREVIETGAHQEKEMPNDIKEKEKDVKIEEYKRTQTDEKIGNDGCDRKENKEENTSVGERGADKSSERENNENEEIEVDEEESESDMKEKSGETVETEEIKVLEEEGGVHFSGVSDASTSETLLEEEEAACQQLEINDEIVKASPRASDADANENDSTKAPVQDDENFGSTDSETGESQVEKNSSEGSELASDVENSNDMVIDDLSESDEVVKEEREEIQNDEEVKTWEDTVKKEESNQSFVGIEEEERVRVNEELAKKKERERERERERMVVERAIREARERAFAEAREKAERASVDKVNAQIRQRIMAEARHKLEKTSSSNSSFYLKDEAKVKAERAAVERATSEARKRALEKAALSQKSSTTTTTTSHSQPTPYPFPDASGDSSDSQRFDGTNSESYLRSKAKLEKHQGIMQRAATALAEKNMRDSLAQKEQAYRNRLSESLDADIKRWSNGKEGNLRALLSTLQYILGTSSGWQPVSLTEIVTRSAVKKAYRKATLYVHPDKLQQRGATIQQKYICEKVFDLLKAAWDKFNTEER